MYETALNQSAYSQTNILLSKYIALRSKVVHAVFKTQKKYFERHQFPYKQKQMS
jgi:hypothetical protein